MCRLLQIVLSKASTTFTDEGIERGVFVSTIDGANDPRCQQTTQAFDVHSLFPLHCASPMK